MATAQDRSLCIFSQRRIRQDVSRCSGYEFEDVVAGMERADIVAPTRAEAPSVPYRARRWLSQYTPLFRHVPSGAAHGPLGRDYDLFGCFLQKPIELLELDSVPDWRRRSRMAFCVLEELWHVTLDEFAPLVKSLSQFDLIACAFESSCAPLAELTGRPVIHLPGAADLLAFAPADLASDRPIDVYYMGRRRPELHRAIKNRLEARGGFYFYDSATRPPIAADHAVHREVLAGLVNRSKLFMVDYGKIGHADQATGQIIWGPRHVEGMAGGAVQVGYAPDSADYHAHFDWPEAVERLPEDPAAAADRIIALLDDPAELDRRRCINLVQALDRHDWAHRWKLILDHFGLDESPALRERRGRLRQLSESL